MALTLFALQNAKPKEKPYKLSDGEGLHLLVQPNGSKWWRFRYQFAGKEKMLSLGTFPEVTLASARTKRNEARSLVAEGIDPSQQRREGTKGKDVDLRESEKIIRDLATKVSESTPPPKAPSMAELFSSERQKLGLEPLENEFAQLDAEADRITTAALVR